MRIPHRPIVSDSIREQLSGPIKGARRDGASDVREILEPCVLVDVPETKAPVRAAGGHCVFEVRVIGYCVDCPYLGDVIVVFGA